MGYGSDTLLKHSARAHPHEHQCLHCHRVVWLHYNRPQADLWLKQWALSLLFFAVVMTFFGIKPLFNFTQTQSVLFVVIAMFLGVPLVMTYARYLSAELKPEK